MRNAGVILLAAGLLAFVYCSTRLSGLAPVPDGVALGDYTSYEAGMWELRRYGAAVGVLIGLLLAFFPRGR